MKSLAEEAGNATDEITALIVGIQSSVDWTVERVREMDERVRTGNETVEEALDALESISELADESTSDSRRSAT